MADELLNWALAVTETPREDHHDAPTNGVAEVGKNLYVSSAPHEPFMVRAPVLFLVAPEYQPPPEHFPGVQVYYRPLTDGAPVDVLAAEACATAEEVASLRLTWPVQVACRQGLNRSCLVAGMALMCGQEQLTADQVVDRMREARGPQAFSDPATLDALRFGK